MNEKVWLEANAMVLDAAAVSYTQTTQHVMLDVGDHRLGIPPPHSIWIASTCRRRAVDGTWHTRRRSVLGARIAPTQPFHSQVVHGEDVLPVLPAHDLLAHMQILCFSCRQPRVRRSAICSRNENDTDQLSAA